MKHEFSTSATVGDICQWLVAEHHVAASATYKLMNSYPRQELDSTSALTLRKLGLTPNATLIMNVGDGRSQAAVVGGIGSASKVNKKAAAAASPSPVAKSGGGGGGGGAKAFFSKLKKKIVGDDKKASANSSNNSNNSNSSNSSIGSSSVGAATKNHNSLTTTNNQKLPGMSSANVHGLGDYQ